MKVWANDLKIGDSFYYIRNLEIKHATIVDHDKGPLTKMNYWNLDNDEIFFVNSYVYTTEEELLDEVIKKLKEDINNNELTIRMHTYLLEDDREKLKKYLDKKKSHQTNNTEDSSIIWYNENGRVNCNEGKDSSLD